MKNKHYIAPMSHEIVFYFIFIIVEKRDKVGGFVRTVYYLGGLEDLHKHFSLSLVIVVCFINAKNQTYDVPRGIRI